MAEVFLDNFAEDDWVGGFSDYLEECETYLRSAKEGTPVDVEAKADLSLGMRILRAYGIALGAGLLIALAVCLVFRAQMKTAVEATAAEEYVPNGGVDIRLREDRFLNTTTSRRKIAKESSSGGGTTVDRDGYSGSGGKF